MLLLLNAAESSHLTSLQNGSFSPLVLQETSDFQFSEKGHKNHTCCPMAFISGQHRLQLRPLRGELQLELKMSVKVRGSFLTPIITCHYLCNKTIFTGMILQNQYSLLKNTVSHMAFAEYIRKQLLKPPSA